MSRQYQKQKQKWKEKGKEEALKVGLKITFDYKGERVYILFRNYHSLCEILECIEQQKEKEK